MLAVGRGRDRGRDPRHGGHQARRAPRAVAGAAAGAGRARRSSASASPPPSARWRRSRASSAAARPARTWRPRPVSHRGRGRAQGARPAGSRCRSRTWRGSAGVPSRRTRIVGGARVRGPPAQLDLARHPPAPARADPRPPLDAHLREQPAPGRAAGRRPQRAGGRGAGARAPRLARARAARGDRGRAQGRPPARDGRHLVAGAGHRHGRHRPRGADRGAALGGQRPAAHRPRRPPGGRRLARRDLPQVPRRPAGHRGRHARHAATGAVEATRIPRNPLDVLAQQLVAIVRRWRSGRWTTSSRSCAAPRPSRRLPRAQLEGVLDMLSGRYPSDEFAELRPRLVWDRLRGTACARARARGAWRSTNAGTIPDRGLYGVFLADGGTPRRGKRAGGPARGRARRGDGLREPRGRGLRPGRVELAHRGDRARPRAGRARPRRAGEDAVLARRPPGAAGRAGPRHRRASRASWPPAGAEAGHGAWSSEHALDPRAADNLLAYLADQKAATGALPDDRTLVLERTRDEMGDWRLCLLSPWGGRVHAPWALALQAQAARRRRRRGGDDLERRRHRGPPARPRARRRTPPALLPGPGRDRGRWWSASWAAPRSSPRTSARRRPARCCCPAAGPGCARRSGCSASAPRTCSRSPSRYGSFPIILETYRECLQDVFDLPALRRPRAARCAAARCAWSPWTPSRPRRSRRRCSSATSPTTSTTATRRWPSAGRRRSPWTRRSCASCWARPSCASCSTRARSASWSSRCRRSTRRIARAAPTACTTCCCASATSRRRRSRPAWTRRPAATRPASPREELARRWTEALLAERRAFRVSIGGEARVAAAEDAGRLPRRARRPAAAGAAAARSWSRGPTRCASSSRATRARTGRSPPRTWPRALGTGASAGRGRARARWPRPAACVEGEFRPGGDGREWCDAEVLATLRRRSLARLRQAGRARAARGARAPAPRTGTAWPPAPAPRRAAGPTRCST